jgi:hypothetical protein
MKPNAWIALLAYEACVRHATDCRRDERNAGRLASVHSRVLAELRCAIALDIEHFLRAGDGRSGSGVTCCNSGSAQGFVVSRTDGRVGLRRLAVDLEAGTLSCRYETGEGAIALDLPELAIDIGRNGSTLSQWAGGVARTFETVDALSAFLLAPIFGDP